MESEASERNSDTVEVLNSDCDRNSDTVEVLNSNLASTLPPHLSINIKDENMKEDFKVKDEESRFILEKLTNRVNELETLFLKANLPIPPSSSSSSSSFLPSSSSSSFDFYTETLKDDFEGKSSRRRFKTHQEFRSFVKENSKGSIDILLNSSSSLRRQVLKPLGDSNTIVELTSLSLLRDKMSAWKGLYSTP